MATSLRVHGVERATTKVVGIAMRQKNTTHKIYHTMLSVLSAQRKLRRFFMFVEHVHVIAIFSYHSPVDTSNLKYSVRTVYSAGFADTPPSCPVVDSCYLGYKVTRIYDICTL